VSPCPDPPRYRDRCGPASPRRCVALPALSRHRARPDLYGRKHRAAHRRRDRRQRPLGPPCRRLSRAAAAGRRRLVAVLAFTAWGSAQLFPDSAAAGVLDDLAILLFVLDAAVVVISDARALRQPRGLSLFAHPAPPQRLVLLGPGRNRNGISRAPANARTHQKVALNAAAIPAAVCGCEASW
jgi:hypothetical protein